MKDTKITDEYFFVKTKTFDGCFLVIVKEAF